MIRNEKKIYIGLSIFMLIVLSAFAYAAFTGNLNLSGNGINRSSAFNVYFDNLSNAITTGTATVVSAPSITESETVIKDYNVKLITPGDSVSYTFDLINDGDYDLVLSNKILGPVKLSVNGDEENQSALNLNQYIAYKLYDTDKSQELNINTELKSKEVKHLKLVLTYLDTIPANKLPKENVEISNLGVELIFEQTSIAKTDDKGQVLPNQLMPAPENPAKTDKFLSTTVARKDIYTLNIVNHKEIPAGYQSSDCSEVQNKTVMCWWKESEVEPGYYDMYIGSNGKVYAPTNSAYLFRYVGYDKMKSLDLGDYFDTSYVTDMNQMFCKTGGFSMTKLDLGTNFETSNVTNMYKLFFSADPSDSDTKESNIQILTLGDKFDTSNVNNMRLMFSYLSNLISIDLGDKFDTSKATDMKGMFQKTGYNNMTELNLGNKFETSNVTNMSYMFNKTGENKLISLNLGDKFDTTNVVNMNSMFQRTGYNNMASLDVGDKFDTSKVTDMSYMFNKTGYNKLTSLDLGDKFDTSNVNNMENMLNRVGYYSLQELNMGNFGVNHSKVSNTLALLDEVGYPNSTLKRVIVKNQAVADWLNGLATTSVPDYVKNKIVVSTNLN